MLEILNQEQNKNVLKMLKNTKQVQNGEKIVQLFIIMQVNIIGLKNVRLTLLN